MSLKYFHVVFITLSTLLALGFAAWCFIQHFSPQSEPTFWLGVISGIIGLALPVYGCFFLKKMKKIVL